MLPTNVSLNFLRKRNHITDTIWDLLRVKYRDLSTLTGLFLLIVYSCDGDPGKTGRKSDLVKDNATIFRQGLDMCPINRA